MSDLEKLREILLRKDGDDDVLSGRIDERVAARFDTLAQQLPDLLMRTQDDDRLAKALERPLGLGLQRLARNNKDLLVSVLFPLIGPIIRRSIAESLSQLVKDMNRALDHSISPKGLRWRIESIRSGVPFAQIVLKHTLRYRVEHLLLVNNEGGLLLGHAANIDAQLADSDAVAAMLSALQDFAHDAVLASADDGLRTVAVGEMTLHILRGPLMHLAVAVRGELSEDAMLQLQELVEELHTSLSDSSELESHRETFQKELEVWLQINGQRTGDAEPATQEKSVLPIWLKPTLALAACLAVLMTGHSIWRHRQANQLTDLLDKQPGYIAQANYAGGLFPARFHVTGLRDPDAVALPAVLDGRFAQAKIVNQLKPFISVDPSIWAKRLVAEKLLPPGVKANVEYIDQTPTLNLYGVVGYDQFLDLQRSLFSVRALLPVSNRDLRVSPRPDDAQSYALRRNLSLLELPVPVTQAPAQQLQSQLAELCAFDQAHVLEVTFVGKSKTPSSMRAVQNYLAPVSACVRAKFVYAANDASNAVLRISQIRFLEATR